MIRLEVDVDKQLKYIEKKLGALKTKAPIVLTRAINMTAKQARKQLANSAQQTYTVKTSKFNKEMKIKNANRGNLVATISAEGKPMALSDFKTNPTKPVYGGKEVAKAKVIKANSPKSLVLGGGEANGKDLKAFVTKFASGHIAIVQRVPGKRMKSNPQKEAIKEFYSSSVPKMIGDEKRVYGKVKPVIKSQLRKNIDAQIEKLLRSGKA